MKKTIIVFIIIVLTSIAVNAQFFIEGSIGLQYINGNNSDGVKSPSSFSINISPQAGYWLNENIAIGTNATIGISNSIERPNEPNIEKRTYQNWNFSIFGHYKLWGKEKLSLLIETPVGIGGGTIKENTKKIISESVIFIKAFPLVSYDLTEEFSIIAKCDFLSFGFTSNNVKNDVGYKITNNKFDFNLQSTFFSSLSNIKIGFIYNF